MEKVLSIGSVSPLKIPKAMNSYSTMKDNGGEVYQMEKDFI